MSLSRRTVLAGAVGLTTPILLASTLAWAETRPAARNAPPSKWEGPDLDAAKGRTPSKGKGFYALPEKEDEVLIRSRRKPQ